MIVQKREFFFFFSPCSENAPIYVKEADFSPGGILSKTLTRPKSVKTLKKKKKTRKRFGFIFCGFSSLHLRVRAEEKPRQTP